MESYWEGSFREFLKGSQCRELILGEVIKLQKSEAESAIISIVFNGCCLSSEVPSLLIALFKKPASTLRKCHEVLTDEGRKILSGNNVAFCPSLVFRFRLETLQPWDKAILLAVPKEENVGSIVEFKGTVVKVTQPKMIEKLKRYTCTSCKLNFKVWADITQNNQCPPPSRCPNRETCQGMNMKEVPSNPLTDSKDYQEIKVQEKVGKSVVGKIPRSVWVILDEDLVDGCKAGDDVVVIGEVTRRWGFLGGGQNKRTEIEYLLLANNVQVNNYQKSFRSLSNDQTQEIEKFWDHYKFSEVEGRDKLLAAFCPQLAICVTLCGGVERIDQTGSKIRGEPHLLLVGDPGTGKSQLLRYAAKIVPRSVMTTGIGSTGAGLTVSAARDGGQWHLEAGALVMADGGICCIDEFNSIRESDRVAIHEAMEQQSISVAKAGNIKKIVHPNPGLVCQLRTRCSVLACVNPKGKYDREEPVEVNVGIASPLLSRFDLVYLLLDSKNPSWDERVSKYILEGKDSMVEMSKKGSTEMLWSFAMMQSYFSYCKQFSPTMSTEASQILTRYYIKRRECVGNNMARATVRLLQSAIRLSEAHARLMCHGEVTVFDAVSVVYLLETSMDSNGSILSSANPLHSSFPENPTYQYLKDAEMILKGLDLTKMYEVERRRIQQNQEKKPKKQTESLTQALCLNQTDPQVKGEPDFNSLVSTKITEQVTKLKRRLEDSQGPKPVLARASSKIMFAEDDLSDLDNFQLPKKSKLDESNDSMSFSISQGNLMTSTQLDCKTQNPKEQPSEKRDGKFDSKSSPAHISPGLSSKTISKLLTFSAPKADTDKIAEKDNSQQNVDLTSGEGLKSSSSLAFTTGSSDLSDSEFDVCIEKEIARNVELVFTTSFTPNGSAMPNEGTGKKSLRDIFGQDNDNVLDDLDNF